MFSTFGAVFLTAGVLDFQVDIYLPLRGLKLKSENEQGMGFSLKRHSRRTDARLTRQLLVNLNERLGRLIEGIRVFHSSTYQTGWKKRKYHFFAHHIRDSLM